MASFLNKLVGGVEQLFGGGKQQAAPAPQPKPQPRINLAQLNQAFNRPVPQQVHPLFMPAPQARLNLPIAPNQNDASSYVQHLLTGALQNVPRGVVTLGISGQNLNKNKPQTPVLTPNHLLSILTGATPIKSLQEIQKEHGGGVTGGLAAAGSLAADLPSVPGKKQAAEGVAKVISDDVGKTSLEKAKSVVNLGEQGPKSTPQSLLRNSQRSGKSYSSPKINIRAFPKSIRQSQNVQANTPLTPNDLWKTFQDIPYFREIQKSTLSKASDDIKANPIKALNDVLSPTARPTSDHIAKGTVLLADALRRGDADVAEKISRSLASKGTGLGQAVAMFNTINRTTPSGAFHWATKLGADSSTANNFYKRALGIDSLPDGQAKSLARYKLAEDITALDPSPAAKQGVELWRSLLLTGPRTHTGNLLSNTIEAVTKQGFVNPVATAIDKGVSLFTGKRSRGLTLGGLGKGTKEGVANAKTYIKTGYNPMNIEGKYDANGTVFSNNTLGKIAKGISQPVYRVLGAADQPYRLAARTQALTEQAKAAALNKGLKGEAQSNFIKEFMANPPREALEHSIQIGDRSVFGNQTILGNMASGIKRPVNVRGKQVYSGAAGEFVVPFTQVPSSIATRIVERSPLGFASAAKDIVNAAKGKGFDQYMFTEKLANASVGTGASLVVGKELAKNNMITLGYPTDKKEQELWKEEGKQPYSVKVGNKWLSLNYVQPFGSMLAWGAAYQTSRQSGSSVEQAAAQAAAEAGKAVTSQSFLQGLSGGLNAIQDPAQSAAKYIKSAAQSIVPGIVRTAAIATDPYQRQTNGVGQAIEAGIPGLRKNLPIAQDSFGNNLPSGNNNPLSSLNNAINPLKPSNVQSTSPLTPELRRLQDSKQGIVPTSIQADSLGKGTTLNKTQQHDLQGMYGQALQSAWEGVVLDPRYQNLDDAAKQKVLSNTSDKVLLAAKAQYAANNNLPVPKLNTASRLILEGKLPNYFSTSKSSSSSDLSPTDRYQNALDTYNANQSSYSPAKKITVQKSLAKLKVESGYGQDVLDAYSLSKSDLYNLITTSPNGNDLATKLNDLDQKLYQAGLITTPKFKYGFAPSTGSRSSSGGTAKIATLKYRAPSAPKSIKAPKIKTRSTKPKKGTFKLPSTAKAKKIKVANV